MPSDRSPLSHVLVIKAPSLPSKPLRFIFPSLLKHCTAHRNLNHGKRLHAALLHRSLQSDRFIAASLITMYARCGSLADAAHVFAQLPHCDAAAYNAIISAYFHHNRPSPALSLLRHMHSSPRLRPDAHSLTILLTALHRRPALTKQAHSYRLINQLNNDPFLATALMDSYSKCDNVSEACKVFDGLPEKSVFAWNAMVAGYCRNGWWERSLEMFRMMRREGPWPQAATFSSVLTACAAGEDVDFGEGVHCEVVKSGFEDDAYVRTSLLGMYARCGLLDRARGVFCGTANRGVELWNSMLSACVSRGFACDALDIYREMRLSDVRCDSITASNVLSACGSTRDLLGTGRAIHGELIKRADVDNQAVQSSLMTMYMKNGSVVDAEALFDSVDDWDIVVWGSMISGFCQNKRFDHALRLFSQLIANGLTLDSAVIASAASACAGLKCLQQGYLIHGHAIKSGMCFDVFTGSALVDMYAKCGVPQLAASVLYDMPYKNLAVWNSMISGYGHNGILDESIHAFCQILQDGLIPDSISITSVVASVSNLAALAKGKMVHGYQVRNGIRCDIHAENALLDMYMKCGCRRYAQHLFERMPITNIVSWNTMICGFGSAGHCLEAMRLFEKMQSLEILPDETTFLSLISSCSHSGLVEEGLTLFQTMIRDYSIVPRMEHYANMVDLLGRAGRLNEAYCFIKDMLTTPDESIWLCFLSACRAHRATDLGEIAADHLLRLKPEGSGSYTQLLNFYGELGMLDKAASVKVQMKEAGVRKNPGCSWIELKDRVQVFYSGDSSSPSISDIHDTLRDLKRTMRDHKFS